MMAALGIGLGILLALGYVYMVGHIVGWFQGYREGLFGPDEREENN